MFGDGEDENVYLRIDIVRLKVTSIANVLEVYHENFSFEILLFENIPFGSQECIHIDRDKRRNIK